LKLKDFVEVSLLLAVGFILHSFFPPILFGMKPDFALSMLFVIILIKKDFKIAILAGIATGIFTALTTGFPGGQIANIIDKIVTTIIVSTIVINLPIKNLIYVGIVNGLGTILSGVVFLGSAGLLFGLPGPFMALIMTVVIPAAAINTFIGIILYTSVLKSKKIVSTT